MKTLQILSLFTLSIFLVSTVSALMVADAQLNNGSSSYEIEKGERVALAVYFTTYDYPMDISVKMYNSNNQLIHTFIDSSTENYFFEELYDISESVYEKLGNYEIRVSGSDNADDSDEVILNLKVVEKENPEVTIYSPENGKTYGINDEEIKTLRYKIYDKNVVACKYIQYIGGEWYKDQIIDCKNGQEASVGITSYEGKNTFVVYAEDRAGNYASKAVTYYVESGNNHDGTDTTAPEITIYSPLYGKTYTSQIEELHYKIYDENIDSCEYSIDATRHELDCKNGQDAYISLKSKSGSNTWTIYAKDKAGNIASRTITFNVNIPEADTTAPIITIVSPEDKKYSTKNINLRVLTNEDANVWFELDDGNKVIMNNPEDHIYTESVKVSDGEHTITFYAEDESGNEAEKSITFSVDTSADNNGKDNNAINNRYFEDEFDREAYLNQFNAKTIFVSDEKIDDNKSSSAWVIWLIIGLIVLVVLIIVISMLRT